MLAMNFLTDKRLTVEAFVHLFYITRDRPFEFEIFCELKALRRQQES